MLCYLGLKKTNWSSACCSIFPYQWYLFTNSSLSSRAYEILGVGLSKVIIDTVIVSDTTNEAHYELAMKTNGMESAFFISNAIFNSVLTLMTGTRHSHLAFYD